MVMLGTSSGGCWALSIAGPAATLSVRIKVRSQRNDKLRNITASTAARSWENTGNVPSSGRFGNAGACVDWGTVADVCIRSGHVESVSAMTLFEGRSEWLGHRWCLAME